MTTRKEPGLPVKSATDLHKGIQHYHDVIVYPGCSWHTDLSDFSWHCGEVKVLGWLEASQTDCLFGLLHVCFIYLELVWNTSIENGKSPLKRKKHIFNLKKKKNLLCFSFLAAQSGILNRTIRKVLKNEKPDTKVRPCCNCVYWQKASMMGNPAWGIFNNLLSCLILF